MLAILHATIYTPDTIIEDGWIIINDGRILETGRGKPPLPDDIPVRDATGLILAPGFLDLQVNGGYGNDFTADPSTIWTVAAQLPQFGVTSFLPTIITAPPETLRSAQQVIREGPPNGWQGALPLGLHAEGPFLNIQKKGAHNPDYLRPLSLSAINRWSPADGVRLVTLAPELPMATEIAAELTRRNVVVSAGHSSATYDQAQVGFAAGIRYATHLFNAMPALHHREPGLAAAVLDNPHVTIGLIADGLHVHPAMIRLVRQLAGPDRLNLVTDAMAALGMPPGEYMLGDFRVTVANHAARLADGTLAGVVESLDAIVRNYMTFTGAPLPEALATVTTTPARLLGIDSQKGRVAAGFDADLILMTPEYQIVETFVAGQTVFALNPDDVPPLPRDQ